MPSWPYRLTFKTPLSIFSGLAVAGLVDRMVVRDSQRLPIVPGSTIKGRWRFFAERLLRTLENHKSDCGAWTHEPERPACKDAKSACTICRWFGSPSVPAALQVGPAGLLEPWRDLFLQLNSRAHRAVIQPDTEIRPGIALARRSRTALPDHLFFDEAVPPVGFGGRIRLASEPKPAEKTLLIAAAKLVDRLGARKAAGRGMLDGGIFLGGAQ
jgi:CRISPR/Cas system CSM-associated protein Csm3 (group 7 of RAMP superfamily)